MPIDPVTPPGGQAPYPLAMVIADMIWRDPGTGKRTILGCFSVIHARHFPVVHPVLAVYAAITDGRGRVPVVLQLVDVDEEHEPIFRGESEVDFTDVRTIFEIDYILANVTFPAPGEYRFQLFAAGEFLLERRLLVNQIPEIGQQQGPGDTP